MLYSIVSAKVLVDVRLDRTQAMALLKELVAYDLVDPSYVSMIQTKPNRYRLQIKCNYNKTRMQEYAKNNNLIIEEDKEQKYLVIYNP